MNNDLKHRVREFWERESCGEVYATGDSEKEYYDSLCLARYKLEPYIVSFARFTDAKGKDALEIGVGMGADHRLLAEARPATLTGIDLTPRAVTHTRKMLESNGLSSRLLVTDAERMPFRNASFDFVYSWGVLHHSPDTAQAFREAWRVLRPGGTARIMIYHSSSVTGYMLWFRYGLLRGRPFRPLRDIYAHHLESPGTKAYSVADAKVLCAMFRSVDIRTRLNFGDLLQGEAGQRHRGPLLRIAKAVWPRWLIRVLFRRRGLLMMIEARK